MRCKTQLFRDIIQAIALVVAKHSQGAPINSDDEIDPSVTVVAEGGADIYPRLGPTSEWDTAAAQAVVEQAGGAVLELDGSWRTKASYLIRNSNRQFLALHIPENARLMAAMVMAPEVPLEDAMAMLPTCGVGFQNALGALAPPEVAVHLEWAGGLRINGASCGRMRVAAGGNDPAEETQGSS